MNKNLKKILIKTKKGVFSQHVGNNSSKFQGDGYDFVELREYESGEDIRKIDWIISAKMQKPYVKVFQTQRQLNVSIVPILNGSAHFGTKKLKHETISEICALLGYATVAQGDNFVSFIANDGLRLNTKRSNKFFAVENMTKNIFEYDVINKMADYKKICDELFKKNKERSLIFLVGDFLSLDHIDLKLLAKKHEVVVIIVRDIFEENPVSLGNVNLVDPSSGKVFEGNLGGKVLKEYKKSISMIDHRLFSDLKKAGVVFTKIYTHENPIVKIMKLFK